MGVPQVPEGWRDADNAGLEGWTADTVRIKNSSHGSGGDGDGGDDDDDGSFRSVTKGTQGQHSPEVGHMAKVISATTFSKGASGGGASTTRELEPLPGVKEDKSDDVQSIDDSRRFPLPIEDQSVLPCRPTDAVDKGVVSQSGSGDKIEEREVSTGRSPSGVGRRGSGSKQHASGGASGRGLNDMLCLGFAVVTCLNMGSVTARQKGFFAAEVVCSSPGAETVLRDLGVWVGWRRAVANANTPMSFDLEELSLAGAAMGYMTVIGHALDIVVNAAGVMLLLHARRKPVEQRMSDAVKRVCWASLMMAVWLCGMTMIGFLVTVKGPVGSAAIDFYSQRNLSCEEEVGR